MTHGTREEATAGRSTPAWKLRFVGARDVGLADSVYLPAAVSHGLTIVVTERLGGGGMAVGENQADGPYAAEVAECLRRYPLALVSPAFATSARFDRVLRGVSIRQIIVDVATVAGAGRGRSDDQLLREIATCFPTSRVIARRALSSGGERALSVIQAGHRDTIVVVSDLTRHNVSLAVEPRSEAAIAQILSFVQVRAGRPGVVYTADRAAADRLSDKLTSNGIRIVHYCNGEEAHPPRAKAEEFNSGRSNVIIARVGRGLGIDRSDVEYVLHTSMPRSLAMYLQDLRVATRGRRCSECLILYSRNDVRRWAVNLRVVRPDAACKMRIDQLHAMDAYCRSTYCRHAQLLEYLHPELDLSSSDDISCCRCDVCMNGIDARRRG